MRFLCDVHISIKLSKHLEQLGYSSEHVNNILNKWHTKDEDIAKYADENNMILITKDQDFRDSFLINHSPKKLLKVNLGNIPNKVLIEVIASNLKQISEWYSMNDSFMIELNQNGLGILTK